MAGLLDVVAAACHRRAPARFPLDSVSGVDGTAFLWLDFGAAAPKEHADDPPGLGAPVDQSSASEEPVDMPAASADPADWAAGCLVAVTPASAADRLRGLGPGVRLARGPSPTAAAAWVGRPETYQARHPAPEGAALDVRDRDADPVDPGTGRFLRLLAQCAPAGSVLDLGAGEGVSSAWLASGLGGGHRLVAVEQDSRKAVAARRRLRASAADVPHEVIIGDARGLRDQLDRAALAVVDLPASEYGSVTEACLTYMPAGAVLVVRRPNAPGGWSGAGLRVHPRVVRSGTLYTPAALDVSVLAG